MAVVVFLSMKKMICVRLVIDGEEYVEDEVRAIIPKLY